MKRDVWVKKFKQEIVPLLIEIYKPTKILIFGSRITGGATKDSDIDVIIISERFKNIPFLKRMAMILKQVDFPKHIDFICYTLDEFERIKDKSSVVIDALETGAMVKI